MKLMAHLKTRKSSVVLGILLLLCGAAQAQSAAGPYFIYTDTDETGDPGLTIRAGEGSPDAIGRYTPYTIAEFGVNRGGSSINTALTVTGVTSLNSTLGVAGLSTTTGVVNAGVLTQTGATSINTNSGNTANTTIGATTNTTTIQSGTNVIMGSANSMLSTGQNTITGATNTITGANNSLVSITGANAITAATTNDISAATNNIGAVTNNISATGTNNIQGPTNNIGTNSISANNIGNISANTTVTATAGNASQALNNTSANTTLSEGTSGLAARVGAANVTTTGQVLLSNNDGSKVDANGKIMTSGAMGPTAAVTLTNGYGNTHGLVVTESQTTLSGGTQSSSMTLSDRAATFSNAQNGAPITVTGVADGRSDFDAVNVRQFAGAIAAVTAQANIPALSAGQDRTVGLGMGNFMGKSALAMGVSLRGGANAVYKATLSSGLNAGARKAVVGVGGAWGF